MNRERAKSNAEAAYNFLKQLRDILCEEELNVMRESDQYEEAVSHLGCCAAHLEEAIKELA